MSLKKMKPCLLRHILFSLGLLLAAASAHAQQHQVKGTVTDAMGEPLIGANVIVKGTSMGVSTDIDGNYTLGASADATIVYSYVGYKTQEIKVDGRSTIDVILQEDQQLLEEVVVVGYGTLSKKELSSSIVQVDKSQFQQGAVNDAMAMVAGKVAGLNVNTTAAANPNSTSSIQVRGATSISASNGPLVVIDGIAGADLRNVASQDIESITVLKDAGSAAIYGTRGANGVILVTTKKGSGSEGTTKVTYDSWVALNFAKPEPDVLSADEFRRSRRGADYGYSTDWYDLITRDTSYDVNQYVSVDGTTKNGYYGASLNYKKANGLDLRSGREEYGARFVIEQRILENRAQINASLSARKVKEEWGDDGLFDTALTMNPTMPVKNEDGSYYQPTSPTGAVNPVNKMLNDVSEGDRMYVLGSADVKYNIFRTDNSQLSTTLSYALHYNDLKQGYYTPSTSSESYWNGYDGRAEIRYQKWWTNRLEWLGNYMINFNDHDIKAVVGYSWERTNWEQFYGQNNDFAYDTPLWHGIGSGSYLGQGKAVMYAGKSESTLIGFFGRVNYNWKDMLFASASIRHEGSTKFGADSKWGTFPSASVAWEMTKMEFMEDLSPVINSLKPRVSYGVTGRSDFDAYQSLSTYSSNGSYLFNNQWVVGYAPSVNANSELAWEKSTAFNVGVDFMFWNRLHGSIEYFDRRSNDLLYRYTAPQPPFVYDNILVNVGSTKNTGIELALTGDILVDTPVKWTSGINYSYGTTKLTKLSNNVYQASHLDLYLKPGVGTSEYFFRVQEGGKIGQFYGYEYAGVDADGNMMVLNKDNQPIYASGATVEDKRYIGNGTPSHFLSWNNTFTWKNWDLNIFFRGAFGFEIFNMRKYGMGLQGCGTDNVLRDAYLDDANVKTGGGVISSYFLEKGDYMKLENVTLGYTFTPKNRKVLESLRVYLSAKNLFTLTKYSGNDPSSVSVNGIEPGVDTSSAYPTATQLSLGVTLTFH